jgi:hypothetical protein
MHDLIQQRRCTDSEEESVSDRFSILSRPSFMQNRILCVPDLFHVPQNPARASRSREIVERIRDIFPPYESGQLEEHVGADRYRERGE